MQIRVLATCGYGLPRPLILDGQRSVTAWVQDPKGNGALDPWWVWSARDAG